MGDGYGQLVLVLIECITSDVIFDKVTRRERSPWLSVQRAFQAERTVNTRVPRSALAWHEWGEEQEMGQKWAVSTDGCSFVPKRWRHSLALDPCSVLGGAWSS